MGPRPAEVVGGHPSPRGGGQRVQMDRGRSGKLSGDTSLRGGGGGGGAEVRMEGRHGTPLPRGGVSPDNFGRIGTHDSLQEVQMDRL